MQAHGRGQVKIDAEIRDAGVARGSREQRVLLHLHWKYEHVVIPVVCLKPLIDCEAITNIVSLTRPRKRDFAALIPLQMGLA